MFLRTKLILGVATVLGLSLQTIAFAAIPSAYQISVFSYAPAQVTLSNVSNGLKQNQDPNAPATTLKDTLINPGAAVNGYYTKSLQSGDVKSFELSDRGLAHCTVNISVNGNEINAENQGCLNKVESCRSDSLTGFYVEKANSGEPDALFLNIKSCH